MGSKNVILPPATQFIRALLPLELKIAVGEFGDVRTAKVAAKRGSKRSLSFPVAVRNTDGYAVLSFFVPPAIREGLGPLVGLEPLETDQLEITVTNADGDTGESTYP